jgi:plasmid stabilization system protein ParE
MEKNREVIWSLQAKLDLLESLDFIQANWNEEIAQRFLNSITHKITLLTDFPLMGRAVKYPKNCRKVLIKPYYLLFYRFREDRIEIIRLFDGRRNPELIK